MQPVVHFEIPADDKNRMSEFYSNAFGWQTHILGPEMGEYVLVTTTETDENMMIQNPGEINGGFYKRSPGAPVQHISVVIQVDDITKSMQRVKKAGGKVLGEPDQIPGVGMFVYVEDTEGNVVGILQPNSEE